MGSLLLRAPVNGIEEWKRNYQNVVYAIKVKSVKNCSGQTAKTATHRIILVYLNEQPATFYEHKTILNSLYPIWCPQKKKLYSTIPSSLLFCSNTISL